MGNQAPLRLALVAYQRFPKYPSMLMPASGRSPICRAARECHMRDVHKPHGTACLNSVRAGRPPTQGSRWRGGRRADNCCAYTRPHSLRRFPSMKYVSKRAAQSGKLGWILLWLIGVPIPVLLFLYLIRGCT
jgi:hypothetical protein